MSPSYEFFYPKPSFLLLPRFDRDQSAFSTPSVDPRRQLSDNEDIMVIVAKYLRTETPSRGRSDASLIALTMTCNRMRDMLEPEVEAGRERFRTVNTDWLKHLTPAQKALVESLTYNQRFKSYDADGEGVASNKFSVDEAEPCTALTHLHINDPLGVCKLWQQGTSYVKLPKLTTLEITTDDHRAHSLPSLERIPAIREISLRPDTRLGGFSNWCPTPYADIINEYNTVARFSCVVGPDGAGPIEELQPRFARVVDVAIRAQCEDAVGPDAFQRFIQVSEIFEVDPLDHASQAYVPDMDNANFMGTIERWFADQSGHVISLHAIQTRKMFARVVTMPPGIQDVRRPSCIAIAKDQDGQNRLTGPLPSDHVWLSALKCFLRGGEYSPGFPRPDAFTRLRKITVDCVYESDCHGEGIESDLVWHWEAEIDREAEQKVKTTALTRNERWIESHPKDVCGGKYKTKGGEDEAAE